MQSNKISFKGQNIYVGIDVHLKTWHVTTLTESGCKYSFAQHADAKELFDRLNKKFPEAHYKSAYETGFCGFSVHYALTELGFENIVVNPADIPTTGKEKAMKTDAVDSEKIAWSLKRGELTGIYVKDKRYMDDTNLMRLRQRFIRDLSRQKNRTKHLLYTQGVVYPERFSKKGTHWSRNFIKWLREDVELLSEEKRTLMLLCNQVEHIRKDILAITREIRRLSTTDRYKENFSLHRRDGSFCVLFAKFFMRIRFYEKPAAFKPASFLNPSNSTGLKLGLCRVSHIPRNSTVLRLRIQFPMTPLGSMSFFCLAMSVIQI